MTPTLEALYHAAQKADDDFQAAVVRQFGAKEAGDARYQYRTFNPNPENTDKNNLALEAALAAERDEDESRAVPMPEAE